MARYKEDYRKEIIGSYVEILIDKYIDDEIITESEEEIIHFYTEMKKYQEAHHAIEYFANYKLNHLDGSEMTFCQILMEEATRTLELINYQEMLLYYHDDYKITQKKLEEKREKIWEIKHRSIYLSDDDYIKLWNLYDKEMNYGHNQIGRNDYSANEKHYKNFNDYLHCNINFSRLADYILNKYELDDICKVDWRRKNG